MADEVYRVVLDIKPFKAALAEGLAAWTAFGDKIGNKAFNIRIQKGQFDQLLSALNDISKKMGSTFSEMPKAAQAAVTQTAKVLQSGELATAAKNVGTAMGGDIGEAAAVAISRNTPEVRAALKRMFAIGEEDLWPENRILNKWNALILKLQQKRDEARRLQSRGVLQGREIPEFTEQHFVALLGKKTTEKGETYWEPNRVALLKLTQTYNELNRIGRGEIGVHTQMVSSARSYAGTLDRAKAHVERWRELVPKAVLPDPKTLVKEDKLGSGTYKLDDATVRAQNRKVKAVLMAAAANESERAAIESLVRKLNSWARSLEGMPEEARRAILREIYAAFRGGKLYSMVGGQAKKDNILIDQIGASVKKSADEWKRSVAEQTRVNKSYEQAAIRSYNAQVGLGVKLRELGDKTGQLFQRQGMKDVLARMPETKSFERSLMDDSYRQEFFKVLRAEVAAMKAEEAQIRRDILLRAAGSKALAAANRRQTETLDQVSRIVRRSESSWPRFTAQQIVSHPRVEAVLRRMPGATQEQSLLDPTYAKQYRAAVADAIRELREESRSLDSLEAATRKAERALQVYANDLGKVVNKGAIRGQLLGSDPNAIIGMNRRGGYYVDQTVLGKAKDAVKEQLAHEREVVNQRRLANQEARQAMTIQKGLGLSIADTAFKMGKWLVFYRLVRDAMMIIESAIRMVVRSGLEYTKALETQRLGLQATLSEHYKVLDAQEQELEGAQKLAAMREVSIEQWAILQASALAVVGKTEDLMMLYSGILPYAGRLGKSLEEIQEMTRGAAIAASLMDISFNDARTAMVAMLQGRFLSRNRLVTLLGLTQDELKTLKGTPELFDRIQSALKPFNKLAGQAQNTLAAMQETFLEFVGIVGAQMEGPFVDMFKKLVRGIQEALFEPQAGILKLRQSVQAEFFIIAAKMKEVVKPILDFFAVIREEGPSSLNRYLDGLSILLKALVQLGLAFSKLVLGVAKFTAEHKYSLMAIANVGKWFILLGIFRSLYQWIVSTATAGKGLLGGFLRPFFGLNLGSKAREVSSIVAGGVGASGGAIPQGTFGRDGTLARGEGIKRAEEAAVGSSRRISTAFRAMSLSVGTSVKAMQASILGWIQSTKLFQAATYLMRAPLQALMAGFKALGTGILEAGKALGKWAWQVAKGGMWVAAIYGISSLIEKYMALTDAIEQTRDAQEKFARGDWEGGVSASEMRLTDPNPIRRLAEQVQVWGEELAALYERERQNRMMMAIPAGASIVGAAEFGDKLSTDRVLTVAEGILKEIAEIDKQITEADEREQSWQRARIQIDKDLLKRAVDRQEIAPTPPTLFGAQPKGANEPYPFMGGEDVVEAIDSSKTDIGKHLTKLDATIAKGMADAGEMFGVPLELIAGVMYRESGFKPGQTGKEVTTAAGKERAVGLMQVLPSTAKDIWAQLPKSLGLGEFSLEKLYEPLTNINVGVKYLNTLMKQFTDKRGVTDIDLVIAAYNAGPGRVRQFGNRVPPYRETKEYVANVKGDMFAQVGVPGLERGASALATAATAQQSLVKSAVDYGLTQEQLADQQVQRVLEQQRALREAADKAKEASESMAQAASRTREASVERGKEHSKLTEQEKTALTALKEAKQAMFNAMTGEADQVVAATAMARDEAIRTVSQISRQLEKMVNPKTGAAVTRDARWEGGTPEEALRNAENWALANRRPESMGAKLKEALKQFVGVSGQLKKLDELAVADLLMLRDGFALLGQDLFRINERATSIRANLQRLQNYRVEPGGLDLSEEGEDIAAGTFKDQWEERLHAFLAINKELMEAAKARVEAGEMLEADYVAYVAGKVEEQKQQIMQLRKWERQHADQFYSARLKSVKSDSEAGRKARAEAQQQWNEFYEQSVEKETKELMEAAAIARRTWSDRLADERKWREEYSQLEQEVTQSALKASENEVEIFENRRKILRQKIVDLRESLPGESMVRRFMQGMSYDEAQKAKADYKTAAESRDQDAMKEAAGRLAVANQALAQATELAAGAQRALADGMLLSFDVAQPFELQLVKLTAESKSLDLALKSNADSLARIAEEFQTGLVPIAEYVERMNELREERIELLRGKITNVEQEWATQAMFAEMTGSTLQAEQVEEWRNQLRMLRGELNEILSGAQLVEAAFRSWGAALSSTQSAIGMLVDGFKTFRDIPDDLAMVTRGIRGMFEGMQRFSQMQNDIRQFIGVWQSMMKAVGAASGVGSTIKKFFQILSGWKGNKPGEGLGSAVSSVANIMQIAKTPTGPQASTAASSIALSGTAIGGFAGLFSAPAGNMTKAAGDATQKMGGAVSKFAGSVPMIGAALGAAVAVFSSMFAKKVENIKKAIENNIDKIKDGLEDGSKTLGQSVVAMEAARDKAIKQYSGSKSGRKALKEMLPGIDDEIAAMKQRIKEIRKAWEDSLEADMAGQGAFGDFWRTLMDWQVRAKEYMDTFTEGTQDWVNAQRLVNQSYQKLLEDAKRMYEGQLLDFEQSALSDLERVLDLQDEQVDLAQQLIDLDKQRRDLIKEQAEIYEDLADLDKEKIEIQEELGEAQKDLDEARRERAERLLEIEKQIRDLLVEAAETEAEIRRRGILEAQLSVAEQKASEIAKLRGETAEKLDDLRDERQKILTDRSAEDTYQDRVDRVAEQLEDLEKRREDLRDQLADMQDRFVELDRNADRIREQQQLNAIRLDFARQVAGIEREITGDVTTRAEIEQRRGEISLLNAKETVRQWREVRDIVDSIIQNADNWSFNPPEGFPVIKIQVGDINIDNSTTTTNNGGDNNGGGDNGGGDRPRDGERLPRRKEYDDGRTGFEVYR